jgi:hypothetical protein
MTDASDIEVDRPTRAEVRAILADHEREQRYLAADGIDAEIAALFHLDITGPGAREQLLRAVQSSVRELVLRSSQQAVPRLARALLAALDERDVARERVNRMLEACTEWWNDEDTGAQTDLAINHVIERIREGANGVTPFGAEDAARVVDEFVSHYPESIFLPVADEKKARDGVAADLLREFLPRVAAEIRRRAAAAQRGD